MVAALVAIAAAALIVHGPALRWPFFADDYLFLDQVRGRGLLEVLAEPDPLGNFVRPVSRQLAFWGVTRLAGESPLAFHALALACLLGILTLVFALARRLAGARAGVLAAGLVALHYAADVPLRWASGIQDLLAVLLALAALFFHLQGRRLAGALALVLGLLSKEVVAPAAAIAVALDRGPIRLRLRRAWPLAAATAAWAVLWLVRSRPAALAESGVAASGAGALAALAHLPQVVLGLEWPTTGGLRFDAGALAATALLAAVAALLRPQPGSRKAPEGARAAVRAGLAWALLGALPVAAVASIWSGYYYLFAVCGAALALGAWLAPRPPAWAAAAVALWGIGSAAARALPDFAVARSPWTAQSHLNRFYLRRATEQTARYLDALRRARPTLPAASTLFFAGLKGSVGFQAADGPLLRWAYRDASLRSWYVNQFTRERARGGPILLFVASGDTLVEVREPRGALLPIAAALTASDRLEGARDALELAAARGARIEPLGRWRAWVAWSLGEEAEARRLLAASGVAFEPGGAAARAAALAAVAEGDTARALALARSGAARHGDDPGLHGLLADLLLLHDPGDLEGLIEALAARALAPRDPYAWRRIGMIQLHRDRPLEALESLERYLALAGEGWSDPEARSWVATLRRSLPGGGAPQEGLHQ